MSARNLQGRAPMGAFRRGIHILPTKARHFGNIPLLQCPLSGAEGLSMGRTGGRNRKER